MHPDWTLSPCTTSETRKLETCQDTVQAYLLSPSLLLCICHLFPSLHHPLHTSIDLPGRRQLHVLHSLPRHQTPSYPGSSR